MNSFNGVRTLGSEIRDMSAQKKVIVCIPAFNEGKAIGFMVSKSKAYASEVLVCDDGSSDSTAQVAKEAGAIVVRHDKNMGYGAAIVTLFEAAKKMNADIIVTLDSDGQHDPDQIPAVTEPILTNGIDIVIGSRFLTTEDRGRVPTYRKIGIGIITLVTRMLSYNDITDAQSGFRAYSKNAIKKIELSEKGMSVSSELLIKAKRCNLTVSEVPIKVNYDIEGTSTHNALSHGVSVLHTVIQFVIIKHPLLFFGLPGLVLVIISASLLYNAVELFGETRYVSTPLIVLSLGTSIIGIIMLVTATLIYAMKLMVSGKLR